MKYSLFYLPAYVFKLWSHCPEDYFNCSTFQLKLGNKQKESIIESYKKGKELLIVACYFLYKFNSTLKGKLQFIWTIWHHYFRYPSYILISLYWCQIQNHSIFQTLRWYLFWEMFDFLCFTLLLNTFHMLTFFN